MAIPRRFSGDLRIANASFRSSKVIGDIVKFRLVTGSIDRRREVTVSRPVRSKFDLLAVPPDTGRIPKRRQQRAVARKGDEGNSPGPSVSVKDLKEELRYWRERRDTARDNVKSYARLKKRITITRRQAEMYEKYGGRIPQAQVSSDSEPEEEKEKISQEILDIATTECWERCRDGKSAGYPRSR